MAVKNSAYARKSWYTLYAREGAPASTLYTGVTIRSHLRQNVLAFVLSHFSHRESINFTQLSTLAGIYSLNSYGRRQLQCAGKKH